MKFLYWLETDTKSEDKVLEDKFMSYKKAGIDTLLFEQTDKRNYELAKKIGLKTHRWKWTMNCPEKEIMDAHPEWYSINREGKSCIEDPPYVNYYRWLCPNNEEATNYLIEKSKSIIQLDFVDGLHLDYIRYPDVILPVNLWDKYKIEQKEEYAKYDYCYCENCLKKFEKENGRKVNNKYPSEDLSWKAFRYNSISKVVNKIKKEIAPFGKPLSAAVFPTPDIAKRIVRQDWTTWDLDFVCPMIYHNFYQEETPWIGQAVREGVRNLCGKFPIYAGLFLSDFKSEEDLENGINLALTNGAKGISFFGKMKESTLTTLSKFKDKV